MRSSWIPALVLLGLVIAFRCLGAAFPETLPNFSPLPALFLCGMVFFRAVKAWLLPLGAWVLTDPIVSVIQEWPVFGWHHLGLFIGLGIAAAIGLLVRRRPQTTILLSASLVSAAVFYFAANTVSFFTDPLYAKTAAGFLQAQWTGPESLPLPTWVFLRNLAGANLLFTTLFLIANRSWQPASEVESVAAVSTR